MFKRRSRLVAAAATAVVAAGLLAGCVPGIVLQNGWTNRAFGATDAGYSVVNGIVHLKGAIQTAGTSPLPFTIPADARPATDAYVPIDLCSVTNGRLRIQPNGTVTVQAEGNVFSNAACFTSLDGASYALNPNGFTALTVTNGWTNAPFSTSNAAVRNDGGIIHFKGAIATSGTNTSPFTLPVGFRPATNVWIPVDMCNATKGRLNIAPSGVVNVQAEGPFSNAACFTSLDGASFALNANGFTNIGLVNGWTNAPFGTSNAAVRNDARIVHFKGTVAGGASGVIGTLPIGFRPATNVWIPVDLCTAHKGRVLVSPSGTVQVQTKGPFTDAQCFTSLDGVSFVVDAAADTDGDRLANIWETNTNVFVSADNTGTNPNVADTDGDRINDGDEVLTTVGGLNLRNLGASPLHKNLFMEFDWFADSNDGCGAHSHRPTAAQIGAFHTAFRTAPVSNPDGVGGIQVISDYGQGGPFLRGNAIADADGVIAGDIDGTDYRDYKAANFNANRSGYFHYVLLPHKYNMTSLSSGVAEINGDDLVVSLQCSVTDTATVANTIMHELGHNIGLLHGGNVNTNWKPNYNSVMNYRFQFPGVDSDCDAIGDGVLNFSVGTRITLDESNLNEHAGVCGTRSIDWNGNFFIGGAIVDLNGDGSFSVLNDFNDWAGINFGGVSDADGAPVRREIVEEQPVPAAYR